MWIAVLSVFLYVLGLLLLVYDKYCTVLDVFEKPGLYQNPAEPGTFSVARILISYGSLAGIWLSSGLYLVLGAWMFRFLVSTFTLKLFYNRQVKKWIPHFLEKIQAESKANGSNPSESEMMIEATAMSRKVVQMAMRNESI
jgi:hypothetical protein